MVGRTSPPAQGWLHTYQNILDGTFRFRVREKNVAISLRECLHPSFEHSVLGVEVSVDSAWPRENLLARISENALKYTSDPDLNSEWFDLTAART